VTVAGRWRSGPDPVPWPGRWAGARGWGVGASGGPAAGPNQALQRTPPRRWFPTVGGPVAGPLSGVVRRRRAHRWLGSTASDALVLDPSPAKRAAGARIASTTTGRTTTAVRVRVCHAGSARAKQPSSAPGASVSAQAVTGTGRSHALLATDWAAWTGSRGRIASAVAAVVPSVVQCVADSPRRRKTPNQALQRTPPRSLFARSSPLWAGPLSYVVRRRRAIRSRES
jgi:hypothetical protein